MRGGGSWHRGLLGLQRPGRPPPASPRPRHVPASRGRGRKPAQGAWPRELPRLRARSRAHHQEAPSAFPQPPQAPEPPEPVPGGSDARGGGVSPGLPRRLCNRGRAGSGSPARRVTGRAL